MTVPSNGPTGPKSKMEIETEALVRATTANAALDKARREAEEAEKEVQGLRPLGKNAHVPQVNSVDDVRPFSGSTSDQPSDSSCDSCTTMLAIVSAIVAAAILLLVVWLFFGKASNEQVVAVQKTATEASATAKTAAKNAEEAKAEMAGLSAEVKTLKKDVASAIAKADAANSKADAVVSKADEAIAAMKKAQVASKSNHTHPRHETSPNAGRHQESPRAASQASTNPVGEKTCKVLGTKGEILADFLDATKNPKKIVVTSGAECLRERDAFALATGFPTVKREVHSIGK